MVHPKYIAVITLFVGILLTATPPDATALLQSGQAVPEISGRTIDGQDFNLEQFKGRPVLIKLGTTWCPSCGQQSAEINQVRDVLTEQRVAFVDIYINESPQRVDRYYQENLLLPPDALVLDFGTIARQLNIYLIPRMLLISPDHRVVYDGAPLSRSELKKAVTDLFNN